MTSSSHRSTRLRHESLDDRGWDERVAREVCHQQLIEASFDRAEAYERLAIPSGEFGNPYVSLDQGASMATIHLNQTTTSTPEQFVAGVTDFGPGRSKLFGRSADGYLKVHDQGPTEADVTEGSGGVWERLHYDWSDPNRVVMTTTDSNLWGGASGHTYTFTRKPDGTTEVDAVVVREGKNIKGRALGLVLGIVGKRVLGKELEKTARAIEARNDSAGAAEHA